MILPFALFWLVPIFVGRNFPIFAIYYESRSQTPTNYSSLVMNLVFLLPLTELIGSYSLKLFGVEDLITLNLCYRILHANYHLSLPTPFFVHP